MSHEIYSVGSLQGNLAAIQRVVQYSLTHDDASSMFNRQMMTKFNIILVLGGSSITGNIKGY